MSVPTIKLGSPDARYLCTPAAPWSPEKAIFARHPQAYRMGDIYHEGHACALYRCPDCGLRFLVRTRDNPLPPGEAWDNRLEGTP